MTLENGHGHCYTETKKPRTFRGGLGPFQQQPSSIVVIDSFSKTAFGNMVAKSILKGEIIDAESSAVSAKFSRKKVNFGDITVFEFPNLLGDNPAVTDGAPLTIAWKHVNVNVFTIEYNEFVKQKRPRRRKKDMILSSAQRDTYLLGLGYTLEELVTAAEETRKIQKSRQSHIKSLKTWNKFKAVFDGATRGLRFVSHQEPKIMAAKSG